LLGVDGCRNGWLVAQAVAGGAGRLVVTDVAVVTRLADAMEAAAAAGPFVAALDMPIGLLDAPVPGGRPCDRAARALLTDRRSSVFSPPTRPALAAASFDEAKAAGGLTIQSWNLRGRIAEADACAGAGHPLHEAHPELGFQRLHDGKPLPPKKTADGRALRTALLLGALDGLEPWVTPPGARRPLALRGSAADDLLDALVLCLTAARIADGTASRVPVEDGPGTVDRLGRPMVVWW
jgi:predicted RNase H-like nuclease